MKKLNIALLTLALAASALLPVARVHATGGTITTISGYVDNSTTIHIEGVASAGTDVVAVSVYNADGTSLLVGPESTETDSSYKFSYNITGAFNSSTTYKVCAADFDGGVQKCEDTTAKPDSGTNTDPSDGNNANNPDAGVAPELTATSETRGAATKNISLGLAVILAATATYGLILIRKKNLK